MPVSVGCTLRWLVAKAACKAANVKVTTRFPPIQIGFAEPRAAEAAAHAARAFTSDLQPDEEFLKLEFKKRFLHRPSRQDAVHDELPELYALNVCMCYASSSLLDFDAHWLQSDKGFQQCAASLVPWCFVSRH
jgi:hypothetical protein